MKNRWIGLPLVIGVLALPVAASAQSNPSASQIIQKLMPTGPGLNGPSRGIRPLHNYSATEELPSQTSVPTAGQATVHHAARAANPPAATQAAAEAPSVNLYVQFATGSAELTPAAVTALDELGKALSSSELASYRFKIEGHTDTVGTKSYNLTLSERRADAVADYIEHKYGVSSSRLDTVGLGQTHLLVPTPDQTPEARNRRVEVINLGSS